MGILDRAQAGADDREQWVAERIRLHHRRLHETVEQLSDGRWIRAITHRTENDVMIGIRIDITEMKQREVELARRNEEIALYKADLDELPNSTYVKDDSFRLDISPTAPTAISPAWTSRTSSASATWTSSAATARPSWRPTVRCSRPAACRSRRKR